MPAPVPVLVPTLIPTPMAAMMSAPILGLVSALVSDPLPALVPTLLPAPISCPRSPAILLCLYALVSCCGIPALLSLLFSVIGPPFSLGSSLFRTFKQSLSDEPKPCVSTRPAKSLYPFPALGVYNLTNNNLRKRGSDTILINSYLLVGNHVIEEVDLSFASCRYSDAVKFNR